MRIYFTAAFAIILSMSIASAGTETPGQAVVESSPDQGFRLSPEALRTLEIKADPVASGRDGVELSAGAIVHSQDRAGVYRLRNGWFKLIEVRFLARTPLRATVRSAELKVGDRVVTHGAPLLRVTQMELEGNAE